MNASRIPPCLPGGLLEGGKLRRDFAFRPLDGAVEFAMGEAMLEAPSMPAAVTRVLHATLDSLAEGPATAERIDALCVADRRFLMRELQCLCGHATRWLAGTCAVCGVRFDLEVNLHGLPVVPAGSGFPDARGSWRGRAWHARLPTGADQIWLLRQPEQDLEQRLLQRLLMPDTDARLSGSAAAAEFVALVDAALDAMAPALTTELAADCPECGHLNAVPTEPCERVGTGLDALLRQVHTLASHYHWSEAEILRLPRGRRMAYLALLDEPR